MAINPSIILGATQQAPVALADPLERYGKSLALKNLMGQGDLQALQYQQAQQGVADDQATRAAYTSAGGDETKTLQALLGGGQYKAAQALQKAMLERQDKQASIGLHTAQAGKATWEVERDKLQHGAALLGEARDAQSFDQALRVGELSGIFSPQAAAKMREGGFSPQAIQAYQSAGMTRAQQLEAQNRTAATVETGRHNVATEAGTLRGQDLTRLSAREGHGVTMRGQNLVDARTRESAAFTRDAAGKAPPGYRFMPDGNMEAIPGGPADAKTAKKDSEVGRTLDAYVAARDGLLSGLSNTSTGPISGRVPEFTTAQQVGGGAVAAMAPVLKQIFRIAGEGTFTDKDQELLMAMVPTRTDNRAARAEKMANIDRIVAAKMGMPVPEYVPPVPTGGPGTSDVRARADAIIGRPR